MNRVTAQDFYDYDKCPHRVYLNRFGKQDEKLPTADFLNLLFESALVHEQDVIKGLPYQSPEGDTLEEQATFTIKLMESGADRIYQGVLLVADQSGRPDILERINGKSKFGDYMYKPVDIKSGSGYEDQEKGTLRTDYGMQLFHYAALLEKIQGALPPEGEILNKKADRIVYPLHHFAASYAETAVNVLSLVTGANADEPVRCASCAQCQWWGHCEPILVKNEDISLLPGVGRSRRAELLKAGVRSIQDIQKVDLYKIKMKGIGPKITESLIRHADVVISGKMQKLVKPVLRNAKVKIYFDYEDDPTQELVYLCGLIFDPPLRGQSYHGLFGVDEQGEAKAWEEFQRICVEITKEDFIVFHYSSYEKSKLAQLEKKYGAAEKDALDHFKMQMEDLYPIVTRSVVLPTRGYGLKHIAPFAGHKYSAKDAGGAQSIVWFQEYQQNRNKQDVLKRILTYNEEDCLAMKLVYDWLKSL